MSLKKMSVAVLMAGCASQAPGTQPGAMSAAEHREHAAAHAEAANEHEAQYDPDARVRRGGSPTSSEVEYDLDTYNPTVNHLREGGKERDIAQEHEAAAEALESFTDAECSEFPPESRKVCPLLTVVTGEEDVPGGARLILADGVPPTAVVDHMLCHHAFAQEKGYIGMPRCPMYLKAVQISLSPDGKSVQITSKDDATVSEIRKRARAHISK
ncbi:MAG: hypothetical protein KC766_30990 [Myxococcales bacterium]|nr:hypothetical protein [Myxococcales bacterium]